MPDQDAPLDALRALAARDVTDAGDDGAGWAAHAAVLDRLAATRRRAEAAGWTSLALERTDGPLRLFGIPPGESLCAEVPDDLAPDRD